MKTEIMGFVVFLFPFSAVVMLNLTVLLNLYISHNVVPFSKKFAVSIWGNSGFGFIVGSVFGAVIGKLSRSFIPCSSPDILNCTVSPLIFIFLLLLYSLPIYSFTLGYVLLNKVVNIDSYLLATLKEKEIPKSALNSLKKVLDSTFLYSFGTGTALAESVLLFPRTMVGLGVIEILLLLIMALMLLLEFVEKFFKEDEFPKIRVKNDSGVKRVKNPWS